MQVKIPLCALWACALAACAGTPQAIDARQVAFLNHAYAVVDQPTAEAIRASDYLRSFADFTVASTQADGGERWTGCYLRGRHTYLELFGPGDGGGPVGSSGIGLSPDTVGGLDLVAARVAALGVGGMETALRTHEAGDAQVPWFKWLAAKDDVDSLSAWVMEYLASYMDDPRSGKRPARGANDVVSRERALGDGHRGHLLQDISSLEIVATARDLALAEPLLVASGFVVHRRDDRLVARDRDTSITLVAGTQDAAYLRRIGFTLGRRAPRRELVLGHSRMVVGPGRSATWSFAPPARATPVATKESP